jgi:hypothetical protein
MVAVQNGARDRRYMPSVSLFEPATRTRIKQLKENDNEPGE